MARFDPELYLRLLGEDTLLGADVHARGAFGSALTDAARALVAVGAMSAAKAQTVLEDYVLAEALRGEGAAMRRATMGTRRRAGRKGRALKPRRVVRCDRAIETAQDTIIVSLAILAKDSTRLAVSVRTRAAKGRRRRGRGAMFGRGLGARGTPRATLVDDRGRSTATSFTGGGYGDQWEGYLVAEKPLALDTAWIELDGSRVELSDEPPACEVSVQALAPQPPAYRYLWQLLATAEPFHHEGEGVLERALDALLAAGALAGDDPVIAELRAVQGLVPRHPGPRSLGRRAPPLPEPWRSLLARSERADGPVGTLALGAVTPVFDGYCVAAISLESDADGFALAVETTGELAQGPPFGRMMACRRLAWWARDDRDNHYLGQIGNWGGSDGEMQGTVNFSPALDPKARRLELMPTAETARAVIGVALSWPERETASLEAGA